MIKDFLEIQFFKIAKWLILKGYNADCKDYEPECISCQARKTIEFIDNHIRLIKL
jgi:hypothetical protein